LKNIFFLVLSILTISNSAQANTQEQPEQINISKAQILLEQGQRLEQLDTHEGYKEAFELYKQAAKLNYAPAQFALGEMYFTGKADTWKIIDAIKKGKTRSAEFQQWKKNSDATQFNTAYSFFMKAADQGYSEAYVRLADMYFTGLAVPANKSMQLKYLSLGAAKQNPNAFAGLGLFYSFNNNLSEQLKSFEYYKKSADLGHIESQMKIGDIYASGNKVIKKDHTKSYEYFSKAAKQNDAKAILNLAFLDLYAAFINGETHREAIAKKLFEKSANLGSLYATEFLANYDENVRKIKYDWKKKDIQNFTSDE
jgi:TPR repeat protein